MANLLLLKEYVGYVTVGVLDTPCYPCRYYGGFILHQGNGEYSPAYNGAGFCETRDEALELMVKAAEIANKRGV